MLLRERLPDETGRFRQIRLSAGKYDNRKAAGIGNIQVIREDGYE
jgi:hypothetical protein